MTRTPQTLRTIGRALYGSCWLGDLADALGVAVRSVERWQSGKMTIPDGIWPELEALCRQRGRALETLANDLSTAEGAALRDRGSSLPRAL